MEEEFFDPLLFVQVEQSNEENDSLVLIPPQSINTILNNRQCQECGQTFTQKSSLNQHVTSVHLGIKPYICEECGATFSRKSHLIRHRGVHEGDHFFICHLCNAGFSKSGYLARHLHFHDLGLISKIQVTKDNVGRLSLPPVDLSKPEHQCSKCGLITETKSSLKHHIKISHDGDKVRKYRRKIRPIQKVPHVNLFMCINCDALFGKRDLLATHMKEECPNISETDKKCLISKTLESTPDIKEELLNGANPEFILPGKIGPEFILPLDHNSADSNMTEINCVTVKQEEIVEFEQETKFKHDSDTFI